MILESRKWRLILPGLALLITTALILGYSDLASYALQTDTPHALYRPSELSRHGLDGRFTVLRAQADLDRAVALHRDGHTSYWVPVRGYTDKEGAIKLFVLADDIHVPATSPAGALADEPFSGRLVRFDDAPHAGDALKLLTTALNDPVAPDTYVLIEGEAPKVYRPVVPFVGGLGLVWFISLAAFTRAWRRTPRRR
ncbi:MAG TPA: hypothetical protein VM536_13115 [Chloroflexia bacterium]|nr:hypothetical protein [Chloroflexia bacterium]